MIIKYISILTMSSFLNSNAQASNLFLLRFDKEIGCRFINMAKTVVNEKSDGPGCLIQYANNHYEKYKLVYFDKKLNSTIKACTQKLKLSIDDCKAQFKEQILEIESYKKKKFLNIGNRSDRLVAVQIFLLAVSDFFKKNNSENSTKELEETEHVTYDLTDLVMLNNLPTAQRNNELYTFSQNRLINFVKRAN